MSIYRHMLCPICNTKLKTTNSRQTTEGLVTWRRKNCPNCNISFTSKERLDLSEILSQNQINYSRPKLNNQLSKIISKNSLSDLSNILDTIELNIIRQLKLSDNKKDLLDQSILEVLSKLDHPAELRYRAALQED